MEWKYGMHPSLSTVEKRLSFVEDIFIELGAIRTNLNKDHRERFNEREVFEYKGEYYQADVIYFDEKPYIVIEWTDDKQLADKGLLEDVEPLFFENHDPLRIEGTLTWIFKNNPMEKLLDWLRETALPGLEDARI